MVLLGTTFLQADEYVIKTVKILPMESYPARVTISDITIAADPYSTNEKSFSAFDIKDLNSQGYFSVHVIIQNKSQDFLTIHTRNILLVTKSGEQLYTTPATLVVEDVANSKLANARALSDFLGKELTNRWIDPGAVADGFLFFFTPDSKRNLFPGSTLYIPKLEKEGTRESLGPFLIPLDPAISTSE